MFSRLKPLAALATVLGPLVFLPAGAGAAGVPLVDAAGAPHGTVKVVLARGLVQMKIVGLVRLPSTVGSFTAHEYKAYLLSSTDPANEVYLTDVYPDARERSARKVALGGDLSQMGLDRVVITAFSKDGQSSADVLTAAIAP